MRTRPEIRVGGEELTYWKDYVSANSMLASELAFSMIYNNIQSSAKRQAMASVGLTRMPSRFFLIQVDDYQNATGKLKKTQEFHQKPTLVRHLDECLEKQGIEGFAANLIGMDKVICFLCLDEENNREEDLQELAACFQVWVRERSSYTISLCISRVCRDMSDYSHMFPDMEITLAQSYFHNKEMILPLQSMDLREVSIGDSMPEDLYSEYLVCLVRRDRRHFDDVTERIMEMLQTIYANSRQVRVKMIRLMEKLAEGCRQCGIPESEIRKLTDQMTACVMTASYLSDIRIGLESYYQDAVILLERYAVDEDHRLRVPVQEYIAEHFAEPITVGSVAAIVGYSEGHFSRTFRGEFGMPFVRFLLEYRLKQSAKLLAETGIPIEEIAYQVGMNHYSYFCTVFRKQFGVTPGQYRRMHSEGRNPEGIL